MNSDWPIDATEAARRLYWTERSLKEHAAKMGIGRRAGRVTLFSETDFEALYRSDLIEMPERAEGKRDGVRWYSGPPRPANDEVLSVCPSGSLAPGRGADQSAPFSTDALAVERFLNRRLTFQWSHFETSPRPC